MNLKIMAYNILFGFHSFKPPFRFEKHRQDLAQKIIAHEKPDILALTEAYFGGENPLGKIIPYRKIFDFKYGFFAPTKNEHGSMFLGNIKPCDIKSVFLDKRGAGIMSVFVINGKKYRIDIVHPRYDGTDSSKIAFMKEILRTTEDHHIITGDFNALSDEDEYDKEILLKSFRRFAGPTYRTAVNRLLERKLIPFIKSNGFVDVLKHHDDSYTIPTDLIDKEKLSPLRMDYFFATEEIKVKDARVIKNDFTEQASDHYPIVMTIEL